MTICEVRSLKRNAGSVYLLWILLSEAVGVIAGWLTRVGTQVYSTTMTRPPLSPPAIVFPVVWTVLFALMGIGGARIYLARPSEERSRGLRLFAAQLAVNFFWSIIFFNLQAYGLSFIWILLLWILIIAMIRSYRKVDRAAAWLQVPYLLWVTFAAYLTLGVWILNR